MPLFDYKARNRDGLLLESQIDAGSPDAVAAQLLEAGITPVQITLARPDTEDALEALRRRWKREKVSAEDLIMFARHMYTLTRAGVPIIRAIGRLGESARSRVLGEALQAVGEDLRAGHELSAAMQRHARIFPRLFVAVIQVGENTGQLEEAFKQIAEYMQLEHETRKQVKGATRYPIIVLLAVAGALVVVNMWVIPAFADTFAAFGAELPLPTRMLIATSDFFQDWWMVLLLLGAASVFGARIYVRTDEGCLAWDRYKLRMPLVGAILERATLARYARAFALTIRAGLPVTQTLQIVSRAVDNEWVCERLLALRSSIERGETMWRAATACGLFTPLILDMIAVGEESGALDDMHREIAECYEREVEYELKRMTDLMEPILIVAVGGIVLLLALGVYLPMWDLGAAVRG